MTTWPMVFSRRGAVLCKGFAVMVDLRARVLCEVFDESDESETGRFFVNGATPGGFAAGSFTRPTDVERGVAETIRDILMDMAADAKTSEEFKRNVIRFFGDSDRAVLAAWEKRHEEVAVVNRRGDLDAAPFEWMLRATGQDTLTYLDVREVDPDILPRVHYVCRLAA